MALISTRCPIDGTRDADVEVYPANFDEEALNPATFSARRTPDRIHYRMVRNRRTGCLRADPILDGETLLALYAASEVTDEDTARRAAGVYRHYLERFLHHLPDRRGVLEIGCGQGPFLELAADLGFERRAGIEPGEQARRGAPDSLQGCIEGGFLDADRFPSASFSLICGFQVLDHLSEPNAMLRCCHELLAPGGLMYWICHDIGAPLPRLLGERCPMIDIEHPVLYDRRTLTQLFRNHGYGVLEVFGVRNAYPLSYWLRLAPLPSGLKRAMSGLLRLSGLGRLPMNINVGNMGIVARKGTIEQKEPD